MKLLCRAGLHDWKHWREISKADLHRTMNGVIVRRNIGYMYVYERSCRCCGKTEHTQSYVH